LQNHSKRFFAMRRVASLREINSETGVPVKHQELFTRAPSINTAKEDKKEEKKQVAVLSLPDGRSFEFPILPGTMGPSVIDIRSLYAKTGHFTYDPGFTSTASCSSEITFIDGDAGQLLHRGYEISELAKQSCFDEVSYLLLFGELPTASQLQTHKDTITHHRNVHQKLIRFYDGFTEAAHPMAIMVGVVGALSSFYHDSLDINNPQHRALSAYRMIAKVPTIAAMAYKKSIGEAFLHPREELSYAENLLYMLFAKPGCAYTLVPEVVQAIETFLVLHMDHEQNASTSTVRIAGSSHANPFACVASGIAALWGHHHYHHQQQISHFILNLCLLVTSLLLLFRSRTWRSQRGGVAYAGRDWRQKAHS
jgi:citrate synthase